MSASRHHEWFHPFARDLIAPFVLLCLAVIAFAPGLSGVPPLDRDEPRFTQASKQMLETGHYVDIRFQDTTRYKKPIGIYWLQVAAVKLTGHGADAPLWVYRLPSFLGGILAVLLTYWAARAFTGPPAAFLAGLFVVAAIILGVESHLGKTDASLLWTVVLAQGALARIWLYGDGQRRWGLAFCFWTALALGVLIKGPITPMVAGFTVLGLFVIDRKVGWFKSAVPLWGFIWFLVLVIPWFVAIAKVTHGAFFDEAVGHDLLGKITKGQESHGAPPGVHVLFMLLVFWPLPGFFLLAVPDIWKNRASNLVKFCACWFIPAWIVFEMTGTKLPHYTMPLLPALAICAAVTLWANMEKPKHRALRWAGAVLLGLPAIILPVATIVFPIHLGVAPSIPGVIICVIAAALALFAAKRLVTRKEIDAIPFAIGGAIVMTFGFWGFVGPALSPIWVSSRLSASVLDVASCPAPAVFSAGFNEPSFIFLNGTHTQIGGGAGAADFLASDQPVLAANPSLARGMANCRVAAVESRQKQAFLAEAKARNIEPKLQTSVDGLNINGGDHLDIGLYVVSN